MPQPTNVLDSFVLTRVLDQDPNRKSFNLLGTLQSNPSLKPVTSILLLEKTHFSEVFLKKQLNGTSFRHTENDSQTVSNAAQLERFLSKVETLGCNDIYTWLLGWLSDKEKQADIKITLISPASQIHIDKYSSQTMTMVYETPEMYLFKVVPYIESFPISRIQWVYNILEGKKEADTILYQDPDPCFGFILLPDLKWDQKTISSLYFQAIVHNRHLKSLRDLTSEHIGMLENIKKQAEKVAYDKFGVKGYNGTSQGNVRCFLHYHPSYYHLHVHILAASYTSYSGSIVGQAHLLDDVIDLIQLGVDMKKRTIGYSLGSNSKLWKVLFPSSSSSSG